jgi:hypothetical protein
MKPSTQTRHSFRGVEGSFGIRRGQGEWLLAQHVLAGLQRLDRPLGVHRRRQCHVDRVDAIEFEQCVVRPEAVREPVVVGVLTGPALIPAGDRDELGRLRGAGGPDDRGADGRGGQ